jgi:outer membrane lipoprotein-sorting protein
MDKGLKLNKFTFFLFSLFVLFPLHLWGVEGANEIVAKADAIRAPGGSYTFDATVISFDGDSKKGENGYKAYVKDLDHTLLQFLSPASEKGKSMIMLQDDIWIYLPNVRKPVRVPLKQRLLGEVAIGDMTRANFSHDYDATLAGEEEAQGKACYVLDLVAKSPDKTYNKVKYWVAKEDFRPVKAEYFAVSGKSLKVAIWKEFTIQTGSLRPSVIEYQDSLNKDKKSLLKFADMTVKKLEDKMFTKDYMRTFE